MNAMFGTDSLHALRRSATINRAVGPWSGLLPHTQGVALGWYEDGPVALQNPHAPRTQSVHLPRLAFFFRANGAASYQPGASPRESKNPRHLRRAEGPTHFTLISTSS